MKGHGNSNDNNKPHHLYEIRDSVDDDVFKFGISHDPIDEEGQSNRMKIQVNFLNLGNYYNTFIEIAEDCPLSAAEIPLQKGEAQSVANILELYTFVQTSQRQRTTL